MNGRERGAAEVSAGRGRKVSHSPFLQGYGQFTSVNTNTSAILNLPSLGSCFEGGSEGLDLNFVGLASLGIRQISGAD